MSNEEEKLETTPSYLDEEVPLLVTGSFIKKLDYEGQTLDAKIISFSPHEEWKDSTNFQILMDGEDRILTLKTKRAEGQLRSLLGSRRRSWINKEIKIEFSKEKEFETPNGLKKGVEVNFHSA